MIGTVLLSVLGKDSLLRCATSVQALKLSTQTQPNIREDGESSCFYRLLLLGSRC